EELGDLIAGFLGSITLGDLVTRHLKKESVQSAPVRLQNRHTLRTATHDTA
nr:DNA-binding protein [Acidithiobacillus montserratensis]